MQEKRRCARCDALAILSKESLCLGCHEALDGPPEPLGAAYWREVRAELESDDRVQAAKEEEIFGRAFWDDDDPFD